MVFLLPSPLPISIFFYFFNIFKNGILIYFPCNSTLIVLRNISAHNKSIIESLILLLPIVTNIGCSSVWYYISPARILQNHIVACIVFTGLLSSYTLVLIFSSSISLSNLLALLFSCRIECCLIELLTPNSPYLNLFSFYLLQG